MDMRPRRLDGVLSRELLWVGAGGLTQPEQYFRNIRHIGFQNEWKAEMKEPAERMEMRKENIGVIQS